MPTPKHWLLDFDSSFNTFDETLIDDLNRLFGTSYTVEMVAHWDWWDKLPREQIDYAWGFSAFHSRDWTVALKPQPNAVSVVRSLMRYGDRFTVVSDRETYMAEWIEAWLERQGLDGVEVVVSDRITLPKWHVAEELGLNLAIEDAAHNITDLAKSRKGCPELIYVMDRPWNRTLPNLGEHVVRVNDWVDLIWHQASTRNFELIEQEGTTVG